MIDKNWEGYRQFYELVFGSWIAYFFLVFIWKRIFAVIHERWKYALITLVGGSFYIINHYFFYAPFYRPLIYGYTIVFLILYYCVLVKPLSFSFIKKTMGFLSSVVFTVVYIAAEDLARFLAQGRIIPGIHVPEFFFLVISFFVYIAIIMSYRR